MLAKFVINIAALLVVVNIVPGVSVSSWGVLLATVIVISLLNAILKPILVLLTLPINILTLGLFTLFINALMFYLAAELVKEFKIDDFWAAFLGALGYSFISAILSFFAPGQKKNTPPDNR